MPNRLEMQLIPLPNWTRKPNFEIGENAQTGFEMFESRMGEIQQLLQKEVEAFVNDPDRCFLNKSDGFPLKDRLSGKYYFSDIYYEKVIRHNRNQYRMWVMLHCLENQWLENQTDFDYLGLEAILTLRDNSDEIDFDGFNTSSI